MSRAPGSEAAGTASASSRNPFAAAGFTRWWLGSMVAGTGLGIQTVTVPLFVRDRVDFDMRAVAIASALVAQTLPGALLALVGGTVADRVERRLILARAFGLGALVASVYVMLAGFDVRSVWPVFPLAALVGSAGAFANPARQSLLPQIVTRPQLQNGVIFGTMGFMATLQFLGPSVAGLVVDARGLAPAFALEVGLLAAGAAIFARLHTGVPPPSQGSVVSDLLEGLRFAARTPTLRGLLLLSSVIGVVFIGPYSVTLPLMVPDVFGATDKWVGLLWGCFGGGVFAGSLLLTVHPLKRRGLAVCLTIFLGGCVQILYGTREVLAQAAFLQVLSGLNASVFMNYVMALLQENTEPRMMGRVMSMYTLVFFTSMPLGYAASGVVTRSFGPQTTLVAAGAAALLVGLACLVGMRSVRGLR